MKYLAIILLLSSCSAQYHLNKAIKKGYTCEQTGDTIRITTLDSIPVIINDTIVWEKFITTKDTIIQILEMPKTRYQTRIEYRYKTKVLKQDVLKYKYIYREAKEQRKAVQITKSKNLKILCKNNEKH